MKVILLQNIKGIGKIGDIKNVSDGYGRNFLLAKKLAKLANDGNIKEAEFLKRKAETEEKIALDKAKEIADELSKAINAKVSLDSIDLRGHGEHIKKEGEHLIEVELAPGIKIEPKIVVKGE